MQNNEQELKARLCWVEMYDHNDMTTIDGQLLVAHTRNLVLQRNVFLWRPQNIDGESFALHLPNSSFDSGDFLKTYWASNNVFWPLNSNVTAPLFRVANIRPNGVVQGDMLSLSLDQWHN